MPSPTNWWLIHVVACTDLNVCPTMATFIRFYRESGRNMIYSFMNADRRKAAAMLSSYQLIERCRVMSSCYVMRQFGCDVAFVTGIMIHTRADLLMNFDLI